MRIVVLYNAARILRKGVPHDLICEQEIHIIVPLVRTLLEQAGHRVYVLRTTSGLWKRLRQIRADIDIVLNLAEGFGGENANEPLVPAMLEALDIPFTGASSHNMHLTLDKEKTKLVLKAYGVCVTGHQVFRTGRESLDHSLEYPLIVKPLREEASIGIGLDSVVRSKDALAARVRTVIAKYGQPALVETFIEGREISVGLIGNRKALRVFPPLEFLFPKAATPLEAFRSYEYKWGGKTEVMIKARLPKDVMNILVNAARTAFIATECRDYARVDFRLRGTTPFLLEVNHNPGIGPNAHGLNNTLTKMASFSGITFPQLVKRILRTAAKRSGVCDRVI